MPHAHGPKTSANAPKRGASGPSPAAAPGAIKNERVAKLLEGVLAGAKPRDLFEAIERISGWPGPRPNLELARAVGAEIARAGEAGLELTEELLEHRNAFLVRIGLMALAARASDPRDRSRAIDVLHEKSDEPRKEARDAVIDALATVIAARGDDVVPSLAKFTDGFLHAYVALEALTTRAALDRVANGAEVLARLGEAFDLADESSRSAERAQGVRLLREGLPEQIARVAVRFPEALAWIEERLERERPETREVMRQALAALRKRSVGNAEFARLLGMFEAHAPTPRDPSRIVKGTRRRGRIR